MKLFLSSMHPTNKDALLNLLEDSKQKNVTIIPTGWDTYPNERKETELNHIFSTFKEFNLTYSLLDLVSANEVAIRKKLDDTSLLWVMAGNTFYLNYHIHNSGLSNVISDYLEKGMIYGGESAGAVIAGNTLHGVEKVDDPEESPDIVWEGLNLVNLGVLPHADWEKYKDQIEEAKQEMQKNTEVLTINNDQAVLIVDGNIKVIDNPSNKG